MYSVDRQADFSVESSLRFRAFGEIDGKQGGMAEDFDAPLPDEFWVAESSA